MATRNEITSKTVARLASKQLRSKRSSNAARSVAASALTQTGEKKPSRDTIRLTWLAHHRHWLQPDGLLFFVVNREGYDIANSKTLRGAIDAAMKVADKTKEKGK